MPQATFIHPNGRQEAVDIPNGERLMQFATMHGIDGIIGECGGSMMCATCHVYVDEAWLGSLPARSDAETEMLDCAASEATEASRLSCQLEMSPELDGIVVRLPEAQQ